MGKRKQEKQIYYGCIDIALIGRLGMVMCPVHFFHDMYFKFETVIFNTSNTVTNL